MDGLAFASTAFCLRPSSGTTLASGAGMRPITLRWLVVFGLASFGCGDPEYGGDTRALRLRFGLGGCSSVAASQSTLARTGQTELIVGDPKKRTRLDVTSERPEVVAVAAPQLTLECDGSKCEQTTGRVTLDAVGDGSARLVISSEGAPVDSLTVKVAAANALKVEDESSHATGTVKAKIGTAFTLAAKLTSGSTEVFARSPFRWKVEGDALKPTNETSSRASWKPEAAGTATVTAQFGDLGGSVQVVVEP